ncbi:hypothetical protein BDN72DRAFT_966196 [Pluteus cervinus]|uniref:Uncharacterized protein n=1 Tax=Pluteus cervinus TaxID=181527 RepID=A0ACD3A0P6_9AGAR|nr:hypothetical protein BDN72DRAFT_966196 [Pluteus cervinus]
MNTAAHTSGYPLEETPMGFDEGSGINFLPHDLVNTFPPRTAPAIHESSHSADALTDNDTVPRTGSRGDIAMENANDDYEYEYEQSDSSVGGDLRDDMGLALSELNFEADYAVARSFPLAPNPWLTIKGLGLIGLPLARADASRIISTSRQALYGHGSITVMNIDVPNTWEVASQLVSLGNPEWKTFLKETVLWAVRDGLRLRTDFRSLHCEFHKLSLYETGSHFSSHQNTPIVEGSCATITILLPSYCKGGEVHVSHPTDSKVLSLPPNSFFQTNVFAWHANVAHSIKPIQSGYRLALSYNLIYRAPNRPTLAIPVTGTKTVFLRRTLEKWHKSKYKGQDDSKCDFLALVLQHQYPEAELSRGSRALKGRDANIVANLRLVAEEMGLDLLLASLKYTIRTSNDRRFAHGDYANSDGVRKLTVYASNIVSLTGELIIKQERSFEEYHVVPKHTFEEDNIAGDRYYNTIGDVPMDYWRGNRTILILLKQSREQDFFLSAGGIDYAISELKKADPLAPTKREHELAEKAVARLASPTCEWDGRDQMMEIASSWKDFALWKAIQETITQDLSIYLATSYAEALNTFGFLELQPILERTLAGITQLSQRLRFISSLSVHTPGLESISDWYTAQRFKALATTERLSEPDFPLLVEMARIEGLPKTIESILPFLQWSQTSFSLWLALLKAIRDNMQAGSVSANVQAHEWQELIPQYLNNAIDCWIRQNPAREVTPTIPAAWARYPYYSSTLRDDARVESSVELISIIISLGYTNLASRVLDTLLSTGGTTLDRFGLLYSPLIPRLRKMLAKHHLSITTSPFSSFVQGIIALYLRDMLGGKEQVIPTTAKKLGCSGACLDCRTLDKFLVSPQIEYNFQANQKRRDHVERQIGHGGKELVSYHTTKSRPPHTLVLKKTPAFIATAQWPARQAKAEAFLKLFGDRDVIPQLMGNRIADVAAALHGHRAFQWVVPSSSLTGGDAITVPSSTPTIHLTSITTPAPAAPALFHPTRRIVGLPRRRMLA